MSELIVKNKFVLESLNKISDEIINSSEKFEDPFIRPDDAASNGEKYLGIEYLNKHLNDPEHVGFPVESYAVPIENIKRFNSIYEFVKTDFINQLGANTNALFVYYPPGGFVGWHTNQNNSGYQFVFTWSETGDGYFQVYDKYTKEIIRYDDQPGWNCRHFHFGKEEHEHCWHSAYTNSPRITVCVLFRWWDKPEMKEQVLAMKDQLLEELVTEE